MRFVPKPHRHQNPTDCTQASRIPPSRASGDRLLSNPQKERERHLGATGNPNRRKTMVCSGLQQKKFERAKDDLQGFHGDYQVTAEVINKLPNIDPSSTAEAWLEQLKLGSNGVHFDTCWHENDDDTPACIRAVQGPFLQKS